MLFRSEKFIELTLKNHYVNIKSLYDFVNLLEWINRMEMKLEVDKERLNIA